MCPDSSQDCAASTNIDENARFDTPGETLGWTGEGEIKQDDIANKYCWFSKDARRDFGQQLPPSIDVRVLIRLRGLLADEILIARHPAGVREIKEVSVQQHSLYQIEGAKAGADGVFFVHFSLTSGRTMSIESIQVRAPV